MTAPSSDSEPDRSDPIAPVQHARWKQRSMRFAAGALALLVVLLLAVRALLPLLLETTLTRLARDEAGIRLDIGDLELGLIAGELTLKRVRVDSIDAGSDAAMESEEPILAVRRLRLLLDWRDLLERTVTLRSLQIESPVIHLLQRTDGSFALPAVGGDDDVDLAEEVDLTSADPSPWRYRVGSLLVDGLAFTLISESASEAVADFTMRTLSFADLTSDGTEIDFGAIAIQDPSLRLQRQWLLERVDTPRDEDTPEAPASELSIRAQRIEIEAADFLLRTSEGPLELILRLTARDVATAAGHRFPIEFGMRAGEGELTVDVDFGVEPLFAAGEVRWRDLPVPLFLMLDNPELIPWLTSCRASGQLDVELQTQAGEQPAAFVARGGMQVADFSLVDPDNGELALEWKSLDLTVRELFVPLDAAGEQARRIDLERLEWVAPRIVVTRPPEAVDRLLASLGAAVQSPAEPASDVAASPPPETTIETLVVREGELQFVDRSVTPTHETRIDDLRLDASGVRLPEQQATQFALRGSVRGSDTFSITGSGRSDDAAIEIDVKRLNLVPFDPFARAAGWGISAGSASLESGIKIAGQRYVARNELVLHDLSVASADRDRFAATFGISLDVALALLRKPNGDISLPIPVSGDRSAAVVDLRSVMLGALREAITGALASPLKLMGMVLPGGGRRGGLEPVPCAPGVAAIRADAGERIAALAKVTADKPNLTLALQGRTAPADRAPLALQTLREIVAAGEGLPSLDGAGFLAQRRIRAALDEGTTDDLSQEDASLLQRYVANQRVSDEAFERLAQERAAALREQLIAAGVPASSIEIGDASSAQEPEVGLILRAAGE